MSRKEINNHEKKEPDEAIKHIKRKLTANIQGLLKRIEKEKEIGFIADLMHEIQKTCYDNIKQLCLAMYDDNKKTLKTKKG